MSFQHPELWLLALPLAYILWSLRAGGRVTGVLRALVALCLLGALAGPVLRRGGEGRDLVLLVDRSASMPLGSEESARELIGLAEEARRAGDRVAVVGFGGRALVEQLPSAQADFERFERSVDAHGSDLSNALETGLSLLSPDRPGSLVLFTDGEQNAGDALAAARRANARGVRVDVRPMPRPGLADLSVERLDLPERVDSAEPFQFGVWVRSDRRVEARFEVERDGELLSSGLRVFEPGLNRIVLRDRVDKAGVTPYRVRLSGVDDRMPENDTGMGAVEVEGVRGLLVVNHDGAVDSLVRALRDARLSVDVRTPEQAPLDRLGLTGYRAVILENVAAERIGRGMHALHEFVTERGGGLMLTGGRASFGIGGYHLSPIDELLPVSMEMRQEHRKQSIALGIVMDRSGSMGANVGGGLTKMDLANLGAASAIDLLSPMDSVAVIAVDDQPHLVQDLTKVEDPGAITERVRRTVSMGGGIFVFNGLQAVGQILRDAPQQNRHVILFSDAADSEQQENVPQLLSEFRQLGITVSVIALGTPTDSDAQFLRETAQRGQGDVYFTTDPQELPRLFAQDTLTAARSTFVEEGTSTRVLPDLFGLGEVMSGGFPDVDGYNLTYLRNEGVAGVITADEYAAPLFAFSHQGLGRSAVYTGQIGGLFGAKLPDWPGFAPFFVTAARWLVGQEEPEDLFPSVRREGAQAVVSVEIDPAAETPPDTGFLEARMSMPDGELEDVLLERVDQFRYEARVPLAREGIVLGTVRLGEERFVRLPPVALPYSPEFERATDPDAGERLLRRLTEASGGAVVASSDELFRGPRVGDSWRSLSRELALLALLLALVEIAGRRLQLWGSFARLRAPRRPNPVWARVRGRCETCLYRNSPRR